MHTSPTHNCFAVSMKTVEPVGSIFEACFATLEIWDAERTA